MVQGHTAFAVVRMCIHSLFPPPLGLYLPSPSPQDPSSPGTATSYSTWKRASWPHCRRVARAAAWLTPCSGIPSTLSSLSPTFKEPSLQGGVWSASLARREHWAQPCREGTGRGGHRGQRRGREWVKEKGTEQMGDGMHE